MKLNNLFKNNGKTIGIPFKNNISDPLFCGEGMPTRILASVGLSYERDNTKTEIEKAQKAIQAGAEIITDHSVAGDIPSFHKCLIENLEVPISYLTIYELLDRIEKQNLPISKNLALDLLEEQINRGLSLITIHATANIELINLQKSRKYRSIISTSRGGAALINHLLKTNEENVYWEYFDEVLNLFKKYNITLSLGSTYRPASICDAGNKDSLYWNEIKLMGQLVKKAISEKIPVMVEGIGHAPIHLIPEIIQQSKMLCHGVPYRVLSVATDISLGYDHISSAIAIAIAALSGADLATSITRSEHLGQPFEEDIIEGVVAARIAAHCADIGKFNDFSKDFSMSKARAHFGCKGVIESSIYPKGAKDAIDKYKKNNDNDSNNCSMCGNRCALAYDFIKSDSLSTK